MKAKALVVLLFCAFLFGGCASKDLLVTPGRVPAPAAEQGKTDNWAFWIKRVTDERPGSANGQPAIGGLPQRFNEAKTNVFLDRTPDLYLKEQLTLFLLNWGLEASTMDKAKVYMDVAVHDFGFTGDVANVLDKLEFSVDFDVKFFNPQGDYLGSVRIPEKRWMQRFSPMGSDKESLEVLIRDTLNSTFTALAQSELFKSFAGQGEKK